MCTKTHGLLILKPLGLKVLQNNHVRYGRDHTLHIINLDVQLKVSYTGPLCCVQRLFHCAYSVIESCSDVLVFFLY